MKIIEQLNLSIGKNVNMNMYFNNNIDDRNNYVNDVICVDAWDLHMKHKVVNYSNRFFNEYLYYLKNNKVCDESVLYTFDNDKNSNKDILFYVVFSDVPVEVELDGRLYEGLVHEKEIDTIVENIKTVLDNYKNAKIKVTSNIMKYFTQKGHDEDMLKNKLNELNSQNISYEYIDLDVIDTSNIFCVMTNRISFLFKECYDRKIPIVLTHPIIQNVRDRCVEKYFNSMDNSNFKIMKISDEFYIVPIDDETSTILYSTLLLKQKKYINTTLLNQNLIHKYTNIHLYHDAILLKDLFFTGSNKDVIKFTNKIDDPNTLIVTLNKYDSFHRYLRENNEKAINWLGFDFETLHKSNDETCLRYYMNNYGKITSMYSFNDLDQLCNKFDLPNIPDVSYNVNGIILVCLDSPRGMNYSSINEWVICWRTIFDKLSKFDNTIVVKPYIDNVQKNDMIKEIFVEHFGQDGTLSYDDNSEDLLDYLNDREDIYFCVKRQGAIFGKCFIKGKILLSGLMKGERLIKPDAKSMKDIEYDLDYVLEDIDNIEVLKSKYIQDKFSIMKNITSNIVTLEDIKNGSFVNKIILDNTIS